ncbi:glycerol acyltransferase [Thioflexithrix psekupsensis]|uniref:Glycerol acyltransferase n=2 Tax=Thioflexithrix psekupsensis TaxID=1570016 RepID=A0A251XBT2_9GAMM|nr:glycerol acyltransferase [Thioflexithrix psekupsensis]
MNENPEHSQFSLFKERRFAPYFFTQFLGAFNDNVYKNALVILIAFQAAQAQTDTNLLVNLSAALFILPFFLFSATAGQLADKYEKSRLIRYIKLLEIVIMLLAAVAFYLQDIILLMLILFLMGAQSTLFGPIKYAILPQHLQRDELMGGNGIVEMGTFLAILLGTITGGVLISFNSGIILVSITVISIALLGYFASRFIPLALAPEPELKINWNPFSQTWIMLKLVAQDRYIFLSILAISWFWFYGALYLAQFPNYTRFILGGDETVVTLLLTLFSFGVGLGSLLCERLSGHKVEVGLVPFGAIGITLFSIDLSFAVQNPLHDTGEFIGAMAFIAVWTHWRVMLDIMFIGMFGGFYIVPLYAYIQQQGNSNILARLIAGNNILNALFMVASALLAIVILTVLNFSIPQLFLIAALLNAIVAIYIFTVIPVFFIRFLAWLLIHTVYRVKKVGLNHIPRKGAALLVCNHVSYVDSLVIMACCSRPIRFVMYYKIYQLPLLHFIFKTARTIPIAGRKENPEILEQAYVDIKEALNNGELVCIFPEGGLTKDGELQPFRPGVERVLAVAPVPVIPMALRGLWGSIFSRKRKIFRLPRGIGSQIELTIAPAQLPETITALQLQQYVSELRGDWR